MYEVPSSFQIYKFSDWRKYKYFMINMALQKLALSKKNQRIPIVRIYRAHAEAEAVENSQRKRFKRRRISWIRLVELAEKMTNIIYWFSFTARWFREAIPEEVKPLQHACCRFRRCTCRRRGFWHGRWRRRGRRRRWGSFQQGAAQTRQNAAGQASSSRKGRTVWRCESTFSFMTGKYTFFAINERCLTHLTYLHVPLCV